MPADQMKLIAYGKVMEDDAKNLKEYSIKEGDFLVVMISKVRPLPPYHTLYRQSPNLNPKQKIRRWRNLHQHHRLNRIPQPNSSSNQSLSSNQQLNSNQVLEQVQD
jgi:hypothetical protein